MQYFQEVGGGRLRFIASVIELRGGGKGYKDLAGRACIGSLTPPNIGLRTRQTGSIHGFFPAGAMLRTSLAETTFCACEEFR